MTNSQKAVLFDMDGVLVLTEMLKAKAHVAAVEALGGNAGYDLYIQMLGQSHESIRAAYMQAARIQADPDDYTKIYRQTHHDLLEKELVVRPGAVKLVKTLKALDYLLAVVSSSSTSSVQKVLRLMQLEDIFDAQVSSEDVRDQKPDPASYLLALKKLDISTNDAVIFEDSPSGVTAALRAGIPVIAVRHDFNLDKAFDGAIAVLESFQETDKVIALIQSVFLKG